MKQSASLLFSAAALLPSVHAEQPSIIGTGMHPECIDLALTTIIYEYPVYFSTVYESVGTIFNFLGGENSLVINNPPETIITSTVLTTTVVTTSTTTAIVTVGPSPSTGISVTIGAGFPAGTVVSVPSTTPFVLAYLYDAVGGRRPKGFAATDGVDESPEAAVPFYLQDGELRGLLGGRVGRNESDVYAGMIPSIYENEVTGDFTLVDGVLQWISPDRGEATFYECADGLFAGFPDPPFDNCTAAIVGGISQQALIGAENTTSTTSRLPTSSSSRSSSTSISGSFTSGSSVSSSTGGSSSSGPSSATSNTIGSSGGGSSASTSGTSRSSTFSGSVSTAGSATVSGSSIRSSTSSGTSTTTSGSAPSTAVCPRDNEEQVGEYIIYCDSGLDGEDLGIGVQVSDFEACIARCSSTTGCVSLSFSPDSKFCYLHSTRHTVFTGVDFDSAELVIGAGEPGTSSTITTMTTTSSRSSTVAATRTTADTFGAVTCEDVFPEDIGYDTICDGPYNPLNPDDTVQPPTTDVPNFKACVDLCDMDEECQGFAYQKSSTTCYLHHGPLDDYIPFEDGYNGGRKLNLVGGDGTSTTSSTTTSAGQLATTTGVATTTAAPRGTTTSLSSTSGASTTTASGGNDGLLCTDVDADVLGFVKACDGAIDAVLGSDTAPRLDDVASYRACLDICAASDACQGFSYLRPQQICYIQNGPISTTPGDPDYEGAYKKSAIGGGGAGSTTTLSATGPGASTSTLSTSGPAIPTTTSSTTNALTMKTQATTTTTPAAAPTTTTALVVPGGGPTCAEVDGAALGYTTVCDGAIDTADNTASPGVQAPNYRACLDLCTGNLLCQGFSYFQPGTTCFIHTTAINKTPNRAVPSYQGGYINVVGGTTTSAAATTTTTSAAAATTTAAGAGTGGGPTCAEVDGAALGYDTSCNGPINPLVGDTAGITNIPNYRACLDLCTSTSGCQGFAYFPPGTDCYIHTTAVNPVPGADTRYQGGVRTNAGPGTTTTSGAATTTTTAAAATTTAAGSGGTPGTNTATCGVDCPQTGTDSDANYIYYRGYGIDGQNINGAGTITLDFDACVALCTSNTACNGVAFSKDSSTCYLLDGCHTRFSFNNGQWDSAEKIPAGKTCPNTNPIAQGGTPNAVPLPP